MTKIIIIAALLAMAAQARAQFSIIDSLENQSIGEFSYCQQTNTLTFSPRADSLDPEGIWFSFGICGFRADTLLTVTETADKGVHLSNYPAISRNNKDFWRVASLRTPREAKWMIAPDSDTIYMAMGFPYTCSMLDDYLSGKSGCPSLNVDTIAITEGGKPVRLITIERGRKSHKAKRLVWIICRQHAFESLSNYVLEGMIDYLTSSKCSRKISRRMAFKIVPMVDVESVYSGSTGRMSLPRDFNRDWDNPLRPAIQSIESKIIEAASQYSYHSFWDLHSTFPGGFSGYCFSYYDIFGSQRRSQPIINFWNRFQKMRGYAPLIIIDDSYSYKGTCADIWNARNFERLIISTTIEVDWHLDPDGKPWTLDQYREIGSSMIKAMGR